MHPIKKPSPEQSCGVPPTGKHPPACIDARVVLGDAQVVHIRHGGQTYRLSVTRQGKLILTK